MILIALGANLPFNGASPAQTLRRALKVLGENGVTTLMVSPFYETQSWPDPSDPPFVNAVASVASRLDPAHLIRTLHDVESRFGRVRSKPNSPRTLDLDIVDYDGRVEEGPPVLPHPRCAARGFVLVPLSDVAPAWRHPVLGQSVKQLLAALSPQDRALKLWQG